MSLLATFDASAQTQPLSAYDSIVTNARSLARSGRYDEAIRESERAIATSVTRWEAYVAAASAYAGKALFDDAIGMLQQALVRAPQDRKQVVRDALSHVRTQASGLGAGAAIGYVDVQRVASESVLGRSYSAQLNAVQSATKSQADVKRNEIAKIEGGLTLMSLVAHKQAQANLTRLRAELRDIETQAEARIHALQAQLQQEFSNRVTPIVSALAAARGIQMVLSGADNVVWAAPGTDLTADVIKELDAKGK
jgi:outer membrane protein